MSYFRGRMYRTLKARLRRSGSNKSISQIGEEVAKEYGVNDRTIRRDDEFSANLDSCAEALGDEFRQGVLAETIKVTREQIALIAGRPREERKEAWEEILRSGATVPNRSASPDKAGGLKKSWDKASTDSKIEFLKTHLLAQETDDTLLSLLLERLGLNQAETVGTGTEQATETEAPTEAQGASRTPDMVGT
jgi:hypothetical protein